jgi:DNA-binding Lrp family transcriptional regulator
MPAATLDRTDRKILDLLQRDGGSRTSSWPKRSR